jgi:hypothetical protein
MGKIKKFVTGLFSKKKAGDEEEIIQIQPIEAPDRDFIEHESRYDTPDYQAFLNDMGYINTEEKSVSSSDESFDTIDADAKDCNETDDNTDSAAEEYNETDDNTDSAVEEYNETDDNTDSAVEDPAETSVCVVDQDFIDEGVAELGVNDVWSEEED